MSESLSELLAPNELQAVQQFVGQLFECYPVRVHRTILFGSKARGDSNVWSDIDILVIVDDEEWQFKHTISRLGADISLEFDVLIGPRVISEERWERMGRDGFGLYRNVVTEGIPLSPVAVP